MRLLLLSVLYLILGTSSWVPDKMVFPKYWHFDDVGLRFSSCACHTVFDSMCVFVLTNQAVRSNLCQHDLFHTNIDKFTFLLLNYKTGIFYTVYHTSWNFASQRIQSSSRRRRLLLRNAHSGSIPDLLSTFCTVTSLQVIHVHIKVWEVFWKWLLGPFYPPLLQGWPSLHINILMPNQLAEGYLASSVPSHAWRITKRIENSPEKMFLTPLKTCSWFSCQFTETETRKLVLLCVSIETVSRYQLGKCDCFLHTIILVKPRDSK